MALFSLGKANLSLHCSGPAAVMARSAPARRGRDAVNNTENCRVRLARRTGAQLGCSRAAVSGGTGIARHAAPPPLFLIAAAARRLVIPAMQVDDGTVSSPNRLVLGIT